MNTLHGGREAAVACYIKQHSGTEISSEDAAQLVQLFTREGGESAAGAPAASALSEKTSPADHADLADFRRFILQCRDPVTLGADYATPILVRHAGPGQIEQRFSCALAKVILDERMKDPLYAITRGGGQHGDRWFDRGAIKMLAELIVGDGSHRIQCQRTNQDDFVLTGPELSIGNECLAPFTDVFQPSDDSALSNLVIVCGYRPWTFLFKNLISRELLCNKASRQGVAAYSVASHDDERAVSHSYSLMYVKDPSTLENPIKVLDRAERGYKTVVFSDRPSPARAISSLFETLLAAAGGLRPGALARRLTVQLQGIVTVGKAPAAEPWARLVRYDAKTDGTDAGHWSGDVQIRLQNGLLEDAIFERCGSKPVEYYFGVQL